MRGLYFTRFTKLVSHIELITAYYQQTKKKKKKYTT